MILVKLQMGLVLILEITSAVSFRQGAEVSRVWNKHEKAPDSGIMTLASHIPHCGCSCLPTSLHPNVPFFFWTFILLFFIPKFSKMICFLNFIHNVFFLNWVAKFSSFPNFSWFFCLQLFWRILFAWFYVLNIFLLHNYVSFSSKDLMLYFFC